MKKNEHFVLEMDLKDSTSKVIAAAVYFRQAVVEEGIEDTNLYVEDDNSGRGYPTKSKVVRKFGDCIFWSVCFEDCQDGLVAGFTCLDADVSGQNLSSIFQLAKETAEIF